MLDHSLIVISGGTKGVGKALAQALNVKNATVITTSREIPFTQDKIRLGNINNQYLDVTNEESIREFFSWLSQQDMPLTTFINNAGIGIFKEFTEISIPECKAVIDTNLTGAFICTQYACKIMKEQNLGGRIINIGSIVELAGIELNSVYAASKAGLRALSLVISEEFFKYNITSTHLSLGAAYSAIWNNRDGFEGKDMLDIKKVAEVITYLVSLPFSMRIDSFELTPPAKIL